MYDKYHLLSKAGLPSQEVLPSALANVCRQTSVVAGHFEVNFYGKDIQRTLWHSMNPSLFQYATFGFYAGLNVLGSSLSLVPKFQNKESN